MYLEYFINSRLPSYLNSNPERTYNINYKSIDYSLYKNELTINKLSFIPIKIEHYNTFDVSIEEILLSNVTIKSLIDSSKIITNFVKIIQPVVLVSNTKNQIKQHTKIISDFWIDLYKGIELVNVEIEQGQLSFYENDFKDLTFSSENIGLHLNNLHLDSSKFFKPIPFSFNNIELNLKKSYFKLDSIHQARVEDIKFNDSSLIINDILISNIDGVTYNDVNHYTSNIKDVILKDFTFDFVDSVTYMYSSKLEINKPQIDFFSNVKDKNKKNGILFPIHLSIDTFILNKGDITFFENHFKDSINKENISFKNVNIEKKSLIIKTETFTNMFSQDFDEWSLDIGKIKYLNNLSCDSLSIHKNSLVLSNVVYNDKGKYVKIPILKLSNFKIKNTKKPYCFDELIIIKPNIKFSSIIKGEKKYSINPFLKQINPIKKIKIIKGDFYFNSVQNKRYTTFKVNEFDLQFNQVDVNSIKDIKEYILSNAYLKSKEVLFVNNKLKICSKKLSLDNSKINIYNIKFEQKSDYDDKFTFNSNNILLDKIEFFSEEIKLDRLIVDSIFIKQNLSLTANNKKNKHTLFNVKVNDFKIHEGFYSATFSSNVNDDLHKIMLSNITLNTLIYLSIMILG